MWPWYGVTVAACFSCKKIVDENYKKDAEVFSKGPKNLDLRQRIRHTSQEHLERVKCGIGMAPLSHMFGMQGNCQREFQEGCLEKKLKAPPRKIKISGGAEKIIRDF